MGEKKTLVHRESRSLQRIIVTLSEQNGGVS